MESFTIYASNQYNENGTIIKIDEHEKEKTKKFLKDEDEKWGFDLNRKYSFYNRYDCDDYIYVADLLHHIRKIHRLMYYNVSENNWENGYREIPHLHLKFTEYEIVYKKDENDVLVVDPKGFDICVKPPYVNGSHIVEFSYYWLQEHIKFLQKIFDDNEEMVVDFSDIKINQHIKQQIFTKQELLKYVEHCKKDKELENLWPALEVYVNSIMESKTATRPVPVYWSRAKGEKAKPIGWLIYNEEQEQFIIDMKKKIYNTSGFVQYFKKRKTLVSEIFHSSILMLLAHEAAHVANGHYNLRMKKNEYSNQKDVMMVCELNADHTAIMWLLGDLLYNEEYPNSEILTYKKDDLIFLWSIRIFSAYLALSWTYQDDDREWTLKTLQNFMENAKATHPPYQFRVFNMLNEAFLHVEHLCKKSERAFVTGEEMPLVTADGHILNSAISEKIQEDTLDMIYSFEASFRESYRTDGRDIEQKLVDSLIVEKDSRPDTMNEVPFLFVYLDRAKEEFNRMAEKWSEVRDELVEAGTYRKLKENL